MLKRVALLVAGLLWVAFIAGVWDSTGLPVELYWLSTLGTALTVGLVWTRMED